MTEASTIDFDSLDTAAACEKPYEFELVHPQSKAPLSVFVSVVGPESAAFKSKVRRQINLDRRKAFEAERNPRKAAGPSTVEEDEAQSVEMIADLVKGWRTAKDGKSEPVIYWKGEKLPFSPENLNRWLTHFPWVRGQIDEAASDLGNFLGN
jgi:hypothetical protein